MRTLVAILIMLLVALLAGLMVYILARRALLAWIAHTEQRRRQLLHARLEPWLSGAEAEPPESLGRLRRWPDRRIFVALCLEHLPGAEPPARERLLHWLDENGFIDRWIAQLGRRKTWQREQAAELLGVVRAPRSVDALVAALDDPELDVRMRAAAALGELGGERARAALIGALTEENRWSSIRVANLLAGMGPEVVADLLEAFDGMGRGARLAAIDVIARVGDGETGPFFANLLAAPDADIRARAAAALGRIGYRPAADRLIMKLQDPAWPVRAMAAKALGALGIQAAIPGLQRALRDREWWVRANSAQALRMMGSSGLSALAAMLHDEDRFARDQARAMLIEHEEAS